MKSLLSCLLLAITCHSFAQTQLPCEELRGETLALFKADRSSFDSAFAVDFEIITRCAGFDSLDRELFSPPVLSATIVGYALEGDINYGIVVDTLQHMMASEEYQELRASVTYAKEHWDDSVDRSDSLGVRDQFQKFGFIGTELESLVQIVYASDDEVTYREVISEMIMSEEVEDEHRSDDPELMFNHFRKVESISQLEEASQEGPTLIYFTGWGNIGGRKMEEALFFTPEAQEQFKGYNCFYAMVDDRSSISVEQQNSFPDIDMRTYGQFLAAFQRLRFQMNYQPVIVVVDENMEIIESYPYNPELPDFIDFLNRNSVR